MTTPEKAARLSCIPIWPGIAKWVGLPHLAGLYLRNSALQLEISRPS